MAYGFMFVLAIAAKVNYMEQKITFPAKMLRPAMIPLAVMRLENGALDLWQHPSGNPLDVGLPAQGKEGIYSINNATGVLSL